MLSASKFSYYGQSNLALLNKIIFFIGALLFVPIQAIAQPISTETKVASIKPVRQNTDVSASAANRADYQKVVLESGALFGHNKAGLEQISELGRRQIYDLAIKLRGMRNVEQMTISGHSDVTNGTGIAGYNDKLSLQRAIAIKEYLAELGFDVSRVNVVGMGERQPVKQDCQAPKGVVQTNIGLTKGRASKEEMDEFRLCLQPNRRVEVEIFGQKTSKLETPESNQVAEKMIWLER